jgi:hypothetical protein
LSAIKSRRAKIIDVQGENRKKIRRTRTHNHNIQIYWFPWDCYKVREIADEIYEIYRADCDDPEAKKKTGSVVVLNVKKKGIYNILVLPEKIVVKLAKEYHDYRVSSLLFLPKRVRELHFDDDNLVIKYVHPSDKNIGNVRVKLPKPIIYERGKEDRYSVIKLWNPDDYQLLKNKFLEKVEVDADN